MVACMQVRIVNRWGGAHLRLGLAIAKFCRVVASNHAQSFPFARMRYWRMNCEDPSPLMAASPWQLDFRLTNTGSSLRSVQGLVGEAGGVEAQSDEGAKVWCAKGPTTFGEEGGPPRELQQFVLQQFFSDPTQWRDQRQSKPTPRHPDFRHKKSKVASWLSNRHKPAWVDSQLVKWDAEMKPFQSVCTTVEAQRGLGKLEGNLKVGTCTKLCEDGRITDAVDSLHFLVHRGCHVPNNVFYRVLKSCIALKDLVLGRRIHALTIQSGYEGDAFLSTHLIGLYASHGTLEEAMRVFAKVSTPDTYNWAAIIFAYARHGKGKAAEAIRLYRQMRESTSIEPTDRIYVAVLKACAAVRDLGAGREVHAHILATPRKPDSFVQTGLIDMYAKCRSLKDARSAFDNLLEKDVVAWTAMIAGYAQEGMCPEALALYQSMQEEGIAPPNSVTFVCLLQACAIAGEGALHQGRQLHAQAEERGLQTDVVMGNSLVNMYAKCGSLEEARTVFDKLEERNVVTWNAMLSAYAQHGMGKAAINLYSSMQTEGINPDFVTFVCLLQACAIVAALPLGKELHARIEEQGLQADPVVGAALVNMYAKCGCIFYAQRVFDSLPERTIEAWGALIGGYSRQGDSEVVFDLIDRMILDGIQPDGIIFLSLLTVCSHVGLVDKGRKFFKAMRTEYGISPTLEHYTCMMDLLGRAGHLDEALQMAKVMPFPPTDVVLLTLLGACQKWKNVEIGQEVTKLAESLDVKDGASYVLMANIYASAEMWEDAKEMQARRVRSGSWKEPGQSWCADMGGVVHNFVIGDKKHPEHKGRNWHRCWPLLRCVATSG